ncbi:type IV pilus modification PilV family protein [Massilia sp. TSP1-1-2]|uniref:type IV pilus modification PilV family protein n=1 Tax=Massilia sp. TSP1-1-2 TaxID=2804649 RepID=UPI003CE6DC66
MCTSNRSPAQRGLSMIELIVFIVIISVAVAGVTSVLAYTTGHSADPLQRKQAMLIAEALVEEVSLGHMTFCHPDDAGAETATSAAPGAGCTVAETVGVSAGTARPYFNINDYVSTFGVATSFTAGDSTGKITDVLGNAKFNNQYTALVTIKADATLGPAGVTQIAGSGTADTNLLRITVAVKYGNGEQIVLDRYRTRYAPNSTP